MGRKRFPEQEGERRRIHREALQAKMRPCTIFPVCPAQVILPPAVSTIKILVLRACILSQCRAEIAASAFFSLHRPISLTMNFPKAITDEAFAAIFKPRTRSNKPQEVISTLSNTLQTLDSATGSLKQLNLQDQWNDATEELRAGTEIQHLDATPGAELLQSTTVPKYAPFTPPPPPVPMSTQEALAASAEAAQETQQASQQRTYRAVLTINESTHANGEVTYTAESSPLVAEDPPRTFLERMRIRQERYEEYREQRAEDLKMWAISVKRQRKLKMKKHKYKKLMRRTRNLRRRLDRN
ncbi:hypothetical protein ACMFMF_009638 [Clarireedia jacksonii]